MEDAAKAIELAVGVIIFIVALTIGIVLYNKLADTANNALTINDTHNSVSYNKNNMPSDFGYIYTPEDVYYLIDDIKKGNDIYSELTYIYIYEGHLNTENIKEDVIDSHSEIRKTKDTIQPTNVYDIYNTDSRYKIKYEYKYIEKDILTELNTHKPKTLYIIKYVEEI